MRNTFTMYPLQVDVTSFWKQDSGSPIEVIIFLAIIAVIITVAIILNASKKSPQGKSSGNRVLSGIFYGINLRRMAKNIGLTNEQIKMLEFVFKTDQVTDMEKSINSPTLLDGHFRRAYRVIEQSKYSREEIQRRIYVLFAARNKLESNARGGITSTFQLNDDAYVIFSYGKEKYNLPVLSAKGDQLAIECPKNALGSVQKIQKGDKITPMVFIKGKGFSFETRVVGYSTLYGHNALMLAHSNQLKLLSQRRFRRKQTVIATNINIVYTEGSGKKQRLVVDKKRLTGNIMDISVGGCSIKIKTPVQVGARLKIEFTQGENNVAALGQVLRTNRAGVITVLHIKFIRVTRKSMNIINAFVYEYTND